MDDRPLKGHRVLIVEDEAVIAASLCDMLEDNGAEVVGPLSNFDQAMAEVKRDDFEMAVLDVDLGGRSAFPIADELQRQGIPLIFTTGFLGSMMPERFRDTMIWEKPFDERLLVGAVKRLCETPPHPPEALDELASRFRAIADAAQDPANQLDLRQKAAELEGRARGRNSGS